MQLLIQSLYIVQTDLQLKFSIHKNEGSKISDVFKLYILNFLIYVLGLAKLYTLCTAAIFFKMADRINNSFSEDIHA